MASIACHRPAQALRLGAQLGGGRAAGRRPLRQTGARPARPEDQTGSGERHVAGQPRPLAALGVAPALHQDRLALVQLAADRRVARLPRDRNCVARAEIAVLAEAAVDEGGIEIVIDRPHPAEKDLAADRKRVGVGEAHLEQTATLEQAGAGAERRCVDHQLAAHGANRQPRPRSRSAVTASGSPTTFE